MRELLIVRHGPTEANERRVFTGAVDVPLSARGEAVILAKKPSFPPAQAFFTSGMLRANQTLALLYGDVPYTVIADLKEYNFGHFEGRGHDDLYREEPAYRAWLQEDALDVACPGGETRRAFSQRIARGWEALAAEPWDGLAVLVTHGGVISTLMPMLVPGIEQVIPGNGEGYRLVLAEDGQVTAWEAFA